MSILQLRENEMKYRALFEHATDAIYLLELNEDRFPIRFLDVNPVACKRLGYSKEKILSISVLDFLPENIKTINIIKDFEKGKHYFTFRDEYVFKIEEKIDTEFIIDIFRLGEKEVAMVITRDITERLKTEELLRKSGKLDVVGQLATAIAHEIRNPLATIKGFIQLIQSMKNKENQWYIDVISSEIEQIEVITNRFMIVAKPQAVKIQLNNLSMLAEQVITLLQPKAMMNNIQIRTVLKSEIPYIPCEGNQLKQVFINILENAIEAMSTGGEILVQIDTLDSHQVSICFIDQGCGIPRERIPYLGEPFYSIKEKGVGLGLMICYEIVEAHQGKIVIESEMNKGTTVNVILPIYYLSYQRILLISFMGKAFR